VANKTPREKPHPQKACAKLHKVNNIMSDIMKNEARVIHNCEKIKLKLQQQQKLLQ